MNYDDKTDFEINQLVAKAEGNALPIEAMGKHDIPDYCNKPNDAWPIILDCNMTVVSPCVPNKGVWSCFAENDGGDVTCCDKNPLRAVCILFLMMNEG